MKCTKRAGALFALIVLLLPSACRRAPSNAFVERLEVGDAIVEQFSKEIPRSYPPGAELPTLSQSLSSSGYLFKVEAADYAELQGLAPTLASIMEAHGVEDASIVLLGSRMNLDGKEIQNEKRILIVGGYFLRSDGQLTEADADQLLSGSIQTLSELKSSESGQTK